MNKGRLILSSLPIGRKEDVTLQVLEAFKVSRIVVAEDTRTIKKLLNEYGLGLDNKTILSFHDQSREADEKKILNYLINGEDVYYFSEAGSPVISDPAYPLVRLAHDNFVEVTTNPGACSLIAALEVSGLPTTPFTFLGFMPREKTKVLQLLESFTQKHGTFVLFESPRRVNNLISILKDNIEHTIFPNEICFVRELTKTNQQILRLNKNNFIERIGELTHLGEFIVVLHYDRKEKHSVDLKMLNELCLEMIENGVSNKKLSKLFSESTGISSKVIYQKISTR